MSDWSHAFHLDLETRSLVNLRQAGPYVYAQDWSTDCWVACFAQGEEEPDAWYPGMPVPDRVREAAENPDILWVAHNVGFERILINYILAPRYGWPRIALPRWRCTAARAAQLSLPRDLAGACTVSGSEFDKDLEGNKLIRKMMKPQKTVQVPCILCGQKACEHEPQYKLHLIWQEDPESLERGTAYCKQDVRAERSLLHKIGVLQPLEQAVWMLNEQMNERGVKLDLPTIANGLSIVKQEALRLNAAEVELTSYRANQAAKLKWWLNWEGVDIANLRKNTIRDILMDDETLDGATRKALEIRQEAAKSSNAKLVAFQRRACDDGRMRDNLMYHGAGTGRFAGRGAQLQNMPSRFVLTMLQKEMAAELVRRSDDPELLRMMCGDSPLELISACLRGFIVAADGKEFTVGDYNAIEARGTAWLAGAEAMLDCFANDICVYRRQAGLIYHLDEPGWLALGKDSPERAVGKINVLSLGYQAGGGTLQDALWKERIACSRAESDNMVFVFRDGNPEIPDLWSDMENAAFEAVKYPGRVSQIPNEKIKFLRDGTWLWMRLPSGRKLAYSHPAIKKVDMPWKDENTGRKAQRWSVTFWGVDSLTHKWCEQKGYGGKWTENAVQAIARDVLVEGMIRLELAGYPQVLSVHDEAVAEHAIGFGSTHEFEQIMCVPPTWAPDYPIKAEVWRGPRYKK